MVEFARKTPRLREQRVTLAPPHPLDLRSQAWHRRGMRHRWLQLLAVCVVAGGTRAAGGGDTPHAGKTHRPGNTPPPPATPAAPVKPKFDPHIGSATGLPLPRFVSLRADAVNMRVGPGDAYP